MPGSMSLRIGRCSVIAIAGLHAVVGIVGLYFDAAESIVPLSICGGIAYRILIPQFLLNLAEDLT
jgi:hypothetical protein